MKSRLWYPAVAFLLLGGLTLVVQAVMDAGRGGAFGRLDWAVAVLVTGLLIVESVGLYFDRVGAWVFTVPLAALIGVGATGAGDTHQLEKTLLGASAIGLLLVTAIRSFQAWRRRAGRL